MTKPKNIDLMEGDRSKYARAMRRHHKAAILKTITALGAQAELMDDLSCHYRITAAGGYQVDFWPTTLRWRQSSGGKPRGDSMAGLLAILRDPPPAIAKAQGMPMTTIFTDASYLQQSKAGAWAAWIKNSDGPGSFYSGAFEGPCPSSAEAELMAVANGIHQALYVGAIRKGHRVMVESDSMAALSWILGVVPAAEHSPGADALPVHPAKRRNKTLQMAGIQEIIEMVKAHELRLLVRHVRGHQSAEEGRFYINRECDKLAKRTLAAHLNKKEIA